MEATADIVIVGGGILGMSAAFQIARRSSLRVLVLDKGSGPAEGSTGASSAVCRFKYSNREIVQLATDGITAYRHWSEFLGVSEPVARYQRIGVLWLGNDRQWAQDETARLSGLGVNVDTLDDSDLERDFPAVSTCRIPPDTLGGEPHDCRGGGGHLFERDGGYMDPVDALQDLIGAARARDVEVRFNSSVARIETRGGAVTGVTLADGSSISCGTVLLGAGAWCREFLGQHGLDRWPLEPTRIQIVHIDRPPIEGQLPVVVDLPGGIYFRPQNRGQQIILGSVREEDEREAVDDPDQYARYVDDEFIHAKLFALQHRLGLDGITGPIRSYSGLYTVNRADMHPIVGATPLSGFYVANGCSGHGFKLAPAIGSLIAREVTGAHSDFDTIMNPAFLAFDREPIKLAALNVLA
jgi:glycine/D-amino acid oxidase-like deaminating enzyme